MEKLLSAISDESTGKWSFQKLEATLWSLCLETFRGLIQEILLLLDKNLLAMRDQQRYRIKELKERSLTTLVGEIRIKRRYYLDTETGEYVYLLDEWLGLPPYEQASPGVEEVAVLWATKGTSYRDARDRLKELYGYQVLSHETIRQRLLQTAARLKVLLEQEAEGMGLRRREALFIEADGIWVSFQKKARKRGDKKKREVKLAVVHEGWQVRQGKKRPDYRLSECTYYVESQEKGSEAFWEKARAGLEGRYRDIDKTLIVINGDDAPWIRAGTEHFGRAIYQYDRFHITRDLRQALRGMKGRWQKVKRALDQNNIPVIQQEIEAALGEAGTEKQKERLLNLRERFARVGEFIVDYRARLKEAGYDVPPEWRGLGGGEANVNKFKNRLAKRGRSWSDNGLDGILICLKAYFERWLVPLRIWRPSEADAETACILDQKPGSAGRLLVKRAIQSIATGVKRGHFPALDRGTDGFAALFRELSHIPSVV